MSKKLRLRALYDAVRAVKGGGASEADEPMVAGEVGGRPQA